MLTILISITKRIKGEDAFIKKLPESPFNSILCSILNLQKNKDFLNNYLLNFRLLALTHSFLLHVGQTKPIFIGYFTVCPQKVHE